MIQIFGMLFLFLHIVRSQNNNILLIPWVEQGYYYGYQCTLSFMVAALNFSNYQNIHIYTSKDIAFQGDFYQNLFYVQSGDLKQYWIRSYDCPRVVTNFDICLQIMPDITPPGNGNIPFDVWRKYNKTFLYIVFRVKIAYCPLNHVVKPNFTIFVPLSYGIANSLNTENDTKYNLTVSSKILNLTYRDIHNFSILPKMFKIGCNQLVIVSISFILSNVVTTWYIINLVFSNSTLFEIDIDKCVPNCTIQDNKLNFNNPNFILSKKNISRWSNQQYNYYTNNPQLSTISLTFSLTPLLVGYTIFEIFVISKFNGTIQNTPSDFPPSNFTYNGYYVDMLNFSNLQLDCSSIILNQTQILNDTKIYNNTQINTSPQNKTNTSVQIVFEISSIQLINKFVIVIVLVLFFLMILLRRIPFKCQKWLYFILSFIEQPMQIMNYVTEININKKSNVQIFLLVTILLGKIFFCNYLIVIFCSKIFRDSVHNQIKRFLIYLFMLFNFRFYYLFYSDLFQNGIITSLIFKAKYLYNIHALHLILASILNFIFIIYHISQDVFNTRNITFQIFLVIYKIIHLILSALIIKTTLISFNTDNVVESIRDLENKNGKNNNVQQNTYKQKQCDQIQSTKRHHHQTDKLPIKQEQKRNPILKRKKTKANNKS